MRLFDFMKNSHYLARILLVPVVLLLLLPFSQSACEFPGCGPGEITQHPFKSNLLEYTRPASGSILRPSRIDAVHAYFLRPMDPSTFSVSDDIGICWMENEDTPCSTAPDPGNDGYVAPDDFFDSHNWPEPNHLVLNVKDNAFGNGALPFKRYMIRFRCFGDDSPLRSTDGNRMKDNIDIYLKVVPENTETVLPYIYWWHPPWQDFYAPHEPIYFTFSELMGYLNIFSNRIFGLNFVTSVEEICFVGHCNDATVLTTDSIQGLTPGETYTIKFFTENDGPKEFAPTVDLNGNPITIRDHTEPRTWKTDINVSHVRIYWPFHTPYSNEPDNWFEQLGADYIEPTFKVQVSSKTREDDNTKPLVAMLRSSYPAGDDDYMHFTDQPVTTPGQTFDLTLSILRTDADGSMDLEVHAYDKDDNYLGYDKLRVSTIPLPDIWLMRHSRVADSISWIYENEDEPIPWAEWTEDKKEDLRVAFFRTREWFDSGCTGPEPVPLEDPPKNYSSRLIDDPYSHFEQAFSESDAWKLYLAHLAFSLVVEIDEHVKWSLTDEELFDNDSLRALLDGYQWYNPWVEEGYYFSYGYNGPIVPAPPTYTYLFLLQEGIINQSINDPIESMRYSVSELIGWGRDNVYHFAGGFEFANMFNHYGYAGFPPFSAIVEGRDCTTDTYPYPDPLDTCIQGVHIDRNWIAGCMGMVAFLRAGLRVINIPTYRRFVQCHNMAQFPTLKSYLPHGDSPYQADYRWRVDPDTGEDDPVPGYELLIDYSTYRDWFENLPPGDWCERQKRRVAQITVEYLTNYILKQRCYDIEHSLPNNSGCVYSLLRPHFTIDELEVEWDLWNRLDDAIVRIGNNTDLDLACVEVNKLSPSGDVCD